MTPAELAPRYRALGFTDASLSLVTDRPIINCAFLSREHSGTYQYLALCAGPWEQAPWTEAVLQVFAKPLGKTRQPMLGGALCRTVEELDAAVGRLYITTISSS